MFVTINGDLTNIYLDNNIFLYFITNYVNNFTI